MFEAGIVNLSMKQKFNHGAFSRKYSDSVLLKIHAKGIDGIGECAPRKYVTGEDCKFVLNCLQHIEWNKFIQKIDFSNSRAAVESYQKTAEKEKWSTYLNVSCVIELAVLDLIGKYFSKSVRELLMETFAQKELPNIKQKCINTSQVYDLSMNINEFLEERKPFTFVKVKATNQLEENEFVLKTLRNQLGFQIPISMDANMSWNFETACYMIKHLKKYQPAFYEEPLKPRHWEEYQKLRKETGASILLDESSCSMKDLKQSIVNQSCDAINVRISKNGGLLSAVKMILLCKEYGLSYQIGAQVAEIGPLVAAGRQLAYLFDDYMTFEGGQQERFFDKFMVKPMPLVNRKTNQISYLPGDGLGIMLEKDYKKYFTKVIEG